MRSPRYSTGARPCRPSDLAVSAGPAGAATGHVNVPVSFTDRSGTACWLDGFPALTGVSSGGATTVLHAGHGGFFGSPGPSADIEPGQSAALNLSGGDACLMAQNGEHRVYRDLLIGLPHGTGSVRISGTGFDTICGVWVSAFGVPADQPQPPAPSPLTARISLDGTAHAGAALDYLVTLANPTAKPVALRPCPSYAEYLGGNSRAPKAYVARYYYLNCAGAPAVPAHGSVTFQIRLPLPASLPAGVYSKLDWQIQGGSGPATAVPVTVTGSG